MNFLSLRDILLVLTGISLATAGPVTEKLSSSSTVEVSFQNKHRFYFDNDGNAINSVNGKVEWINNQYFWIAQPTACTESLGDCGAISYSSPDLKHWTYNGPLYNSSAPNLIAACQGQFGSCGRPKVLYNEATKKYVLYGFGAIIDEPGIPVLTSDHLTYGYEPAGRMLPQYYYPGYGVEDLGLAVIDGKGYAVWTGFNLSYALTVGTPDSIWPPFSQTVLIQELTDDFLNGTGDSYPVIAEGGDFPVTSSSPNLIDGEVESPDLFKRGDWWYMVGSTTCSFCNGTSTIAYRAKSYKGPWTRQIVDSEETCGGQAMGVLTIPSVAALKQDTYLYHADMFSTAAPAMDFTAAKGHSFWTLSFNSDGSIKKIDCSPSATYTFSAPLSNMSISTTGRAVNATDGSGNFGDYWSESHWPAAYFYQTWTSSKTGNLTEIGINLAANSPSQNMSIKVFRYHNETELLSPYFVWETLGSSVITASNVTAALQVVKVSLNATVQEGDRLGFALVADSVLVATNALPWGYLLQDTTETKTDHILYALNRGKVSYMGSKGTTSPVYRMGNRELKWYAIVE